METTNPAEVISHIESKKKWLDVDIRGLWRYRDLYHMYGKRKSILHLIIKLLNKTF